jgi:hypothetical protein
MLDSGEETELAEFWPWDAETAVLDSGEEAELAEFWPWDSTMLDPSFIVSARCAA